MGTNKLICDVYVAWDWIGDAFITFKTEEEGMCFIREVYDSCIQDLKDGDIDRIECSLGLYLIKNHINKSDKIDLYDSDFKQKEWNSRIEISDQNDWEEYIKDKL